MDTNEQLIGQVIDDKYRLDRLIGNGGMGAVFGGLHLQLGRPVAIKILKSDLLADELMHARFLREARASARIEHPNAIRVYDFGALEGTGTYLVMEYAEGVSLRQFMLQQGRLSLNLALDLLQQAAAALDAAHANGVIHRDVKPENLMVCTGADGRPVVKVVDFGIAKLLSQDGTTQLTRPTDLIGTPRYMAPEQFTGEEIDVRIDVYALGVVLFEMLTGRAPFEGTFSEIIGKHIYAEPPSLASIGVELPEEIERVVRRALAKSPNDRPQTTLALAHEFAEACGSEIASTVPPAFSVILRSPIPSSELVDPGELPTTSGTNVAGSPLIAREALEADEYLTNVADEIVVSDQTLARPATRFHWRRPSARIVVPLGEDGSAPAIPATHVGRWAAPAAIALAGFLTFGTYAYTGTGGATTSVPAPAAAAVTAPVSAPAAMPLAKAEPADSPDASVEDSAAPKHAESRKASKEPRKAQDSAIKKVGRALRLDRHLRRIF